MNQRNRIDDLPGGGRLAEMPSTMVPKRHRTFLEGVEGNQITARGERLYSVRKRRGLTLAAAARHAGLSPALLSRLERRQLTTSRVFRFEPRAMVCDGPTLVDLNPYLARLYALELVAFADD